MRFVEANFIMKCIQIESEGKSISPIPGFMVSFHNGDSKHKMAAVVDYMGNTGHKPLRTATLQK